MVTRIRAQRALNRLHLESLVLILDKAKRQSIVCIATFAVLCLGLASCSSCDRPAEPVIPVDLTGEWVGSYTLYDGAGTPLTDSINVTLQSDGGRVAGEGVRIRLVEEMPPRETRIVVTGSVIASSFRLEFGDPESGHTAVFTGTTEEDSLKGNLSVDGTVVGPMSLAASRSPSADPQSRQGTDNSADS